VQISDAAVVARAAPSAVATVGGGDGAAPGVELWLAERWDSEPRWGHLAGRGLPVLAALARDAGHPGGRVVAVPVPRLAVIAAYRHAREPGEAARLAVNPILLAALEPDPGEPDAVRLADPVRAPAVDPTEIASTGGNPYSFYGSVAECAYAQRTRCEACLPGATCRPVTNASNGNTECEMLATNSGRGYFQLCIDLSLAITSVDRCTGDAAPACARDPDAADSLTTLANNDGFLSDSTCAGALDSCLAKIYGPPGASFPGPDGGDPPSEPPRSTNVSCGNACSNNNANCDASPSADCSGSSCDNSLSCNNECSSSNDQGNCDACSSSSSSDNSSCGSNSGSSGGSCSSSGSSCNSGSSSNSGCSGGSCNSGSSSCGSGCSNGKCSVAPSSPGPGVGLAMSATWGLLPVPLAGLVRRRARRRRDRRSSEELP
jgi:hypothetical protein